MVWREYEVDERLSQLLVRSRPVEEVAKERESKASRAKRGR